MFIIVFLLSLIIAVHVITCKMRMDEKKRSERRAKQSRSRHMRREPKVDIVKNLSDQEEPTQLLRTSKSTRRVIEVTGKKSTDGLKTAKSARKKLREPKSGEQKSTEQKSKAREQKSSDVKSEEDKHEEKTEDKTALPTEGPLVGYDLIVPTSPNTLTPVRDKSLDEEMKKLAGQNASDDPNAIKDSKMAVVLSESEEEFDRVAVDPKKSKTKAHKKKKKKKRRKKHSSKSK